MFMSLLTNKYVLAILAVLCFGIYIKTLNNTLDDLRVRGAEQTLQIDTLYKENNKLKEERDAILVSLEQLSDKKTQIIRVSEKKLCSLEVVAKGTEGKEKVDEKDVLGSKLPQSIIDSLRL